MLVQLAKTKETKVQPSVRALFFLRVHPWLCEGGISAPYPENKTHDPPC